MTLQHDFRDALGRFASGVTVATTRLAGVDHAMTASAFVSVSLEPPLVGLMVDRRNRFHDAVVGSRSWAVSVLSEEGQQDASWFATRGRPVESQLEHVPHTRSETTGIALLERAVAWLECDTWAEHDGGDHLVLLGLVRAARTVGDGYGPAAAAARPLVYHRSHYAALLRSAADERAHFALRTAIIEDGDDGGATNGPAHGSTGDHDG